MDLDLSDRVALVTGSSRGIGRAIALDLADHGARVAVHYRLDREAAEATLEELAGGPHLLVKGDLSDPEVPRELVAATVEGLGGLDILVNNAGLYEEHPPLATSWQEWSDRFRQTIDVNLVAPASLCWAGARQMVGQGRGWIVNVTSRGAFRGEPDAPAYGASKAGLNSLSQSLAVALAPSGISVFAVAPGWVETDMAAPYLSGAAGAEVRDQSPLGRVARPHEVARVVTFLVADGSEFLTGGIVDVNGASYLRS